MTDWLLALVTVIGASVYLRAATELPQLVVGDEVGPRAFPELVGVGLLLGGALLAWETWRKRAAAAAAPAPIPMPFDRRPALTLAGLVLWTALYDILFEPAGYVAATLVYAAALLIYFHRVRWYWNLLIAVVFTGVAYALFAGALGVVLPQGILLPLGLAR